MATFAYEDREASFVRSTVLVLAIAATAYVAGALLQFPVSSHDASVTFSQPVQAAEPMFRARTPGADTVPPASAVEWGRSDGELIPQPRECDMARGISNECLFMD